MFSHPLSVRQREATSYCHGKHTRKNINKNRVLSGRRNKDRHVSKEKQKQDRASHGRRYETGPSIDAFPSPDASSAPFQKTWVAGASLTEETPKDDSVWK